MNIFIGTSGWQYGDWKGKFYPQDLPASNWLRFYAKYFNSVEVNSSFYHFTREKTFQKWKNEVKEINRNFLFAIKLHRLFTHFRKLSLKKNDLKMLNDFLKNISLLEDFLGPILIQLPPSLKIDLERLKKFIFQFYEIAQKLKIVPRLAIEFRHKSWFEKDVFQFLKKENIALVISDASRWETMIKKTADFIYVRFHGKPQLFVSLYSNEELKQWAQRLKELKSKTLFAYFNNDVEGHAVENALFFKNFFKK